MPHPPIQPLPTPTVPALSISCAPHQAGQEKLFGSLSESDMDLYLNLTHYMQRVPYIVPASISLSRAYRLFRCVCGVTYV